MEDANRVVRASFQGESGIIDIPFQDEVHGDLVFLVLQGGHDEVEVRRWRRAKNGIPGEKPIFRSLVPLLREYVTSRSDQHAALFVGCQGRLGTRQIQALFRLTAR
jgi:hypothetical protein